MMVSVVRLYRRRFAELRIFRKEIILSRNRNACIHFARVSARAPVDKQMSTNRLSPATGSCNYMYYKSWCCRCLLSFKFNANNRIYHIYPTICLLYLIEYPGCVNVNSAGYTICSHSFLYFRSFYCSCKEMSCIDGSECGEAKRTMGT